KWWPAAGFRSWTCARPSRPRARADVPFQATELLDQSPDQRKEPNMPGLLRGVARTAVIAGTATHVSNNVSRRQSQRWAEQEQGQYPPTQEHVGATAVS